MPFVYNLAKVRERVTEDEWERLTTAPFEDDGRKWHPIIMAINDTSMICGFNKITEDNYTEVFRRISQYERYIRGTPILLMHSKYKSEDDQYYFTERDIQLLIGYRCNARTMTSAQWNKHLQFMMARDTAAADARHRTCLYDAFDRYIHRVAQDKGLEIVNCS